MRSNRSKPNKDGRNWLIILTIVLPIITVIIFMISKGISLLSNLTKQVDWNGFPWWYWIIGGTLLLATIFRKSLFSNIPTITTKNWSLPKVLAWAGAIAIIVWFTIPRVKNWWYYDDNSLTTQANTQAGYRPMLLTEGTDMKEGVWYEFYQDDGKLWNFQPTESGTIIYKVVKLEDKTREWRREVIKEPGKKATENRLNPHGIEPNKQAKTGRSIIMIENTSARVIAVR